MNKKLYIIFLILTLFITSAICEEISSSTSNTDNITEKNEKFLIITNIESEFSNITTEFLKEVFLGENYMHSNGKKIMPVLCKKSPEFKTIIKKITGKNQIQFFTYWKKQIFTGKGIPPKQFRNEEELIIYISKNKDIIGIIHDLENFKDLEEIKKIKTVNIN